MTRRLWIAAASAVALCACQPAGTDDQTAADADANAAGGNGAASGEAAADDHQYGPAPDSLPSGAQLAVLHGNPAEAGTFIIRLRFPAGFSVPPHSHPTSEYVTVISGNLSLGMGETLDRSAARPLGPGAFIEAPARMNHYAFTEDGATIQITAQGPFEVTYVNPADDPRNRQAG